MRLGRLAHALTDYEEVLKLTQGIKAAELFRAFQALTRNPPLGDLSALALLDDQVCNTLELGTGRDALTALNFWMTYYDAACVHSALAKLALRDQGKPPDERQRLAQSHFERAMNLLDRLLARPANSEG